MERFLVLNTQKSKNVLRVKDIILINVQYKINLIIKERDGLLSQTSLKLKRFFVNMLFIKFAHSLK